MKNRLAPLLAAVVVFLASTAAFADSIPLSASAGQEGPVAPSVENGNNADAAFFAAHPDAVQIVGQTNTWYENTGGILWLTFTIVVIGVLIAAT